MLVTADFPSSSRNASLRNRTRIAPWSGSSSFTEASSAARATWAAQRPLAERFELVVARAAGLSARTRPSTGSTSSRTQRSSPSCSSTEITSSATRTEASSRCSPRRSGPTRSLADGDRATGDARRRGRPRRRRVRRGRCGAVRVGRDERSRDLPAELPRGRGLARSILPPRSRRSSSRAHRRSRSSAGRGRRRSRSTRLPPTPFPKLVVSGSHHPAFDAICDVLERELPAERVVLPGYGHASSSIRSSTIGSPTSSSARAAQARRSGARVGSRPARARACGRAGSRA